MKTYNFLALLLISIFIFSCSKNSDVTVPNNANTQEQQQNTAQDLSAIKRNVPEFNEKNSQKVTWAQLPAELRNANRVELLNNQPQKAQANALTSASAISYYYY